MLICMEARWLQLKAFRISPLYIQDRGIDWWFFTDVSVRLAPSSTVMCAVCLEKLHCGVDINPSTGLTFARHSKKKKKKRKDQSFAPLQGNF
jgi:hypothetical protein